MDLVITDSKHRPIACVDDYKLDLAFGSDENDFDLMISGIDIEAGSLIFVDGTEYGGIVDDETSDKTSRTPKRSWHGRTWHGILAGKVLAPDSGEDYLNVSGDANEVLGKLIERMRLEDIFSAKGDQSGIQIEYQFNRYVDAYSGIMSMLASSAARLSIEAVDGEIVLSAVKAVDYKDEVDSDLVKFKITRNYRTINHLVCLGTGELKDRIVIDLYANEAGEISQTQTFFGVDEVSATYDYSNAEAAELLEEGTKKLSELQSTGSVDVAISPDVEFFVGDYVSGRDNETGIEVTARVNKKILNASGYTDSVDYEIGEVTSGGGSFSGSSESSGSGGSGGVSYIPGPGISISGNTISAEVTQSELDAVSDRAEDALSQASSAVSGLATKADKDHKHSAADVTSGTLSIDRIPSIPANKLTGTISSSNLPAYVDDVIEGTVSTFPAKGEAGKIYVDTQTEKTYRWSGSTYVEISKSLALGETSATAFRGDYGKEAYDHSKKTGNPHGTTANDVGAAPKTHTHTKSQITDFPASMPASDVYPWAKEEQKPTYTAEEVGASPTGHKHSATDITSGTLPIERGGTGATTSKAANFSVMGYKNDGGNNPDDGSLFMFQYVSPNNTQGSFYTRTAARVWNWIKAKADEVYAAKSHTHNYAGSSSAGGSATSAEKLSTARKITFTGAATGSVSFDGSKDVTVTLTGDSASAQFLAAWPVGSIFPTSSDTPPSVGKWKKLPSMGGNKYLRVE